MRFCGGFRSAQERRSLGCPSTLFPSGLVRDIADALCACSWFAKIITPAGGNLPSYAKQFPVPQDAFAQ